MNFTGMINAALEGNRPKVNFDIFPSYMKKSGLTEESQIFVKQIKKFHESKMVGHDRFC